MRSAGIALGKVAALVVILQLVLFYLRLGYFPWLIWGIWGIGLIAGLAVTKPQWEASWQPPLAIVGVIVAYATCIWISWLGMFDNKTRTVFQMRWEDRGVANDFKESEVVLSFVDYPGNHVGIFSNELAGYLRTRGTQPVEVEFELTKDLGCMRGFHEVRVGELASWKSVGGYAGGRGDSESPWKDPPWCP